MASVNNTRNANCFLTSGVSAAIPSCVFRSGKNAKNWYAITNDSGMVALAAVVTRLYVIASKPGSATSTMQNTLWGIGRK